MNYQASPPSPHTPGPPPAPPGGGELVLTDPQSHSIGAGWTWITEGFELFKKSPGMWMVIFVVYVVGYIAVSFVPFAGSMALGLVGYVFMAGLMLGCREQDEGGGLRFDHLFAGFSDNLGQLILVGVLYMAGAAFAMILGVVASGGGLLSLMSGDPAAVEAMGGQAALVGMLVIMILILPVVMAGWFAPALVGLHALSAVEAMKLSFSGCLKNMLPFLLYGAALTGLYIVALIPFGLGFLVVGPVQIASIYAGYRSIFTAPSIA